MSNSPVKRIAYISIRTGWIDEDRHGVYKTILKYERSECLVSSIQYIHKSASVVFCLFQGGSERCRLVKLIWTSLCELRMHDMLAL